MSGTESSKFSIKDLPCEKVVVYQDRAEIKRLIRTKLKKGENELVINNVSNNIDQDSVRVEGQGNATVLDVVCQNKRVVYRQNSPYSFGNAIMSSSSSLHHQFAACVALCLSVLQLSRSETRLTSARKLSQFCEEYHILIII